MHICFLNWRDLDHPKAGGAEVYVEKLCAHLALKGHKVTLLTSRFGELQAEATRSGYRIVRMGNQVTTRLYALLWLGRHRDVDIVVEVINTLPFYASLVHRNVYVLMFQLAREVWFYEAPRFIGLIGFAIEPLLLLPLRGCRIGTISDSTSRDLLRLGVSDERIAILPVGIDEKPLNYVPTKSQPTRLIYVGRIAPSKRVLEILYAFRLLKEHIPSLAIDIVGRGNRDYEKRCERYVRQHHLTGDVAFHGFVSNAERRRLMASASLLLAASIREGWGLIVTEANAVGTPCIVYNVPGLRDAVCTGLNGLVVDTTPEALAAGVVRALEPQAYVRLAKGALVDARRYDWKSVGEAFQRWVNLPEC